MLSVLCKPVPHLLPSLPTAFSWLCSHCCPGAGSMVSWDMKQVHFQSDVADTGGVNLDLFFSAAFHITVSADGSRSKIIGRNNWISTF